MEPLCTSDCTTHILQVSNALFNKLAQHSVRFCVWLRDSVLANESCIGFQMPPSFQGRDMTVIDLWKFNVSTVPQTILSSTAI